MIEIYRRTGHRESAAAPVPARFPDGYVCQGNWRAIGTRSVQPYLRPRLLAIDFVGGVGTAGKGLGEA
jgi:hypothetical protein